MGGTYNPIHYGHLRAAMALSDFFALQQVRMLPCHQPAHRHVPKETSAQREHMLRLAVADNPMLTVDSREMYRQGNSYTVLSLQEIRQELGADIPLYFMMGTDAFEHIRQWFEWQDLFLFANIVVVHRPGTDIDWQCEFLQQRLQAFDGEHQRFGALYDLPIPALDISSTAIREYVNQDKSIQYLVPEPVEHYIHQHKLYL